jgi:hypothetical protein
VVNNSKGAIAMSPADNAKPTGFIPDPAESALRKSVERALKAVLAETRGFIAFGWIDDADDQDDSFPLLLLNLLDCFTRGNEAVEALRSAPGVSVGRA